MKKLPLLISLVLSFATILKAQMPEYTVPNAKQFKQYYSDQLEPGEIILNAYYQDIFVRTAKGSFVQKIFYPEKKVLTHSITYSNKKFQVKEGPYREWYDNGQLWKEGACENDKAHGVWTFYSYDNGTESEYGTFEMGERTGKWITLDSLGGTTREQFYKAGKLHGECKIYSTDGQLAMTQQFEEGKKISEQRLLDDPDVYGSIYDALDIQPYLKECENENAELRQTCTERKYLEALYKNIKYPALAREENVMGNVLIRFMLEKDGSISEIKVLRGVCEVIEQECRRVMKFMPEWMPGMKNGKPVRVWYNLPIKFKLE
ncbi:MAG: TonB family protein [Saprospiraceae bacterium]